MIYYFSLLTLFLCVVILSFNLRINKSILYLIGFLIPLGVYGIFHHLVFFNDSAFQLALINVQSVPLYFLAPPMLFFYVRSTLKDTPKLSRIDILHFLPTIISFGLVLPFMFKSFDYKLALAQQFIDDPNAIKTAHIHSFYPNFGNVIARPTQLFIYSLICLFIIWKYNKKKSSSSPAVQKKVLVKWLISISVIALLISLSYMIMIYFFITTDNIKKEVFNQLSVSLFSGFAYSIIPVIIMVFPDILYGIPRVSKSNLIQKETEATAAIKEIEFDQIAKDPFCETAVQILNYIEQEKPYLNPKFNIDDVINDLAIPKHHVYYCFKNIIQTKFTELRTNYRIEHAKELLLSEYLDVLTVEGIGAKSGFASKSNFFAVFKESTGLSPIDFIAKNRKSTKNRKNDQE